MKKMNVCTAATKQNKLDRQVFIFGNLKSNEKNLMMEKNVELRCVDGEGR